MQTAELIINENNESSDLHIIPAARLREFNFGTYEGDLNHTMWSDIATDQGITVEEFMATMTPEGFANSVARLDKERNTDDNNWPAEEYATITKRLSKNLDDIVKNEMARKGESGNVLIASHSLSTSALLDILSVTFEIPQGGLKNASVNVINYKNGEYTIKKINNLSYVEKGMEELAN